MGMLGVEFFAVISGALLLFHASRAPWWRRGVLACASLVFVLSYAGNGSCPIWTFAGVRSLLPLTGFALAGFIAVRAAKKMPDWSLALGVIAVYALLRYLPELTGASDWLVTVGASYILFRILHLLFDNSQAALASAPTLPEYLSYVFFFPTFLAGPIWRYEEYRINRDAAISGVLDGGNIFSAFSRIANGCLKILVLTWVCDAVHQVFAEMAVLAVTGASSALFFAWAAIAYLLVFYFDFSGYMDMVIGVGTLFGMTLPENFDAPFQCADVIDFWNRWHITLSKWMQQYLFIPLVAWLSRRFLGSIRIQYLGAVGYLAVFLVVGVWHGANLRFVCFGLILGLAASATKLWDAWLTKLILPAKTQNAMKAHPLYRKLMNALALFIVALALSPLWLETGIYDRFSLPFALCALAAGVPGAVALNIADRFLREVVSLADRPGRLKFGGKRKEIIASLGTELWLAFRCFVVFGILSVQNSDIPAFLYQGF